MYVCAHVLWKSFLLHKVSIKWTYLLNIKIETRIAMQLGEKNKSWLQWSCWPMPPHKAAHWTWLPPWTHRFSHSIQGQMVIPHLRERDSHRMPRVPGRQIHIVGQLFRVSSFLVVQSVGFIETLLHCSVWTRTSCISISSVRLRVHHHSF